MGNADAFDARAATWDDEAKVARARRVAAAILPEVPERPGLALFEYGCGTGLLGLELLPRFARATLADASEGMLAVLRGKLQARGLDQVTALRLDLERDPVPPERFDAVATLLTLHHVRGLERVLAAFHALLRPGGQLFVADLDREDGSFHGPGAAAHDGFDRAELAARLGAAGFADLRLATAAEIEKAGADGVRRRYPVFLAVARRP